ncbi:hypothetical protein BDN71DRAFT_1428211 [Pleurotus eryngii]|uniref:Uncharacterized protein n=1 Tax=Pleurotus eryngii TaxID=5323 RepID=A0A9P6DIM0_PLEER|nr:hypothetical protein BDN71DRAFT_1428211 [Pleurotus eryngii]
MPLGDIVLKQLPWYTTDLLTWHNIASAFSHDFNHHNIEDAYYPAYDSTFEHLLSLIKFNGALRKRAQCMTGLSSCEQKQYWLAQSYGWGDQAASSTLDEDIMDDFNEMHIEEDSSRSYPGHVFHLTIVRISESAPFQQNPAFSPNPAVMLEALETLALWQELATDPPDAADPDVSFESWTMVPNENALTGILDFLFCHSYLVDEAKPNDPTRLYSWLERTASDHTLNKLQAAVVNTINNHTSYPSTTLYTLPKEHVALTGPKNSDSQLSNNSSMESNNNQPDNNCLGGLCLYEGLAQVSMKAIHAPSQDGLPGSPCLHQEVLLIINGNALMKDLLKSARAARMAIHAP